MTKETRPRIDFNIIRIAKRLFYKSPFFHLGRGHIRVFPNMRDGEVWWKSPRIPRAPTDMLGRK